MRLYDQKSNTPVNSDCRKWSRPESFIPHKMIAARLGSSSKLVEDQTVGHKVPKRNEYCGSETSTATSIEISKLYRNLGGHDQFLFDITSDVDDDQESSMKSSSTLSTKSAFQQFNNDTRMAISTTNVSSTDSNSDSSRSSLWKIHSNIVLTDSHESSITEYRNNTTTSYFTGKGAEDESMSSQNDEDYLHPPKLTCTQSSEEENDPSVSYNAPKTCNFDWFNFEANPFREKSDMSAGNFKPPVISPRTSLISPQKPILQARDDRNTPRSCCVGSIKSHPHMDAQLVSQDSQDAVRQRVGNYTKYYQMLLDGSSVFEVLDAMEKDVVDPSIISLVIAASQQRH